MQAGSLIVGSTGVWERVGSGWQVATLGYSLKKLGADGVSATSSSLESGLMRLPLRLGYVGHDNTCQNLSAFQRVRAGMRDTSSQVSTFGSVRTSLACPEPMPALIALREAGEIVHSE